MTKESARIHNIRLKTAGEVALRTSFRTLLGMRKTAASADPVELLTLHATLESTLRAEDIGDQLGSQGPPRHAIKPLATAGARRCDEEPPWPPAPTTRSGAHGATRRSAVPNNQSPRSVHHVHDSPLTPRAWQRRAAVEVRR